jgi:hypothetical protein
MAANGETVTDFQAGRNTSSDKFERRDHGRRYRIAAAVTFSWQTSSGECRQGNGISRDISAYGISVICSALPVPGSPVELTVNLPVPWAKAAFLRGRGTVVRLQPEQGQPWGFAATLTFDEELHEDTIERDSEDSSIVDLPPDSSSARNGWMFEPPDPGQDFEFPRAYPMEHWPEV